MLKDVKVSASVMKRMKSTGEMTEPWGTPELIECRLEGKPSTLTAIDLSERKLPIRLMRVLSTKIPSKTLEMSWEIILLPS